MDGIFRTILVQKGEVVNIKRHLNKLKNECRAFNIIPLLPSEKDINHYLAIQNANQGAWRLKIEIRNEGFELFIRPYNFENKIYQVGIYPEPIHPKFVKMKTILRKERDLVNDWGQKNGYDEVLTIDENGFILEGSTTNVFWKEKDSFYFVDPSLPYYEGLTQNLIIEKNHGKVKFERMHFKEIHSKTIFLCNSLKGIIIGKVSV